MNSVQPRLSFQGNLNKNNFIKLKEVQQNSKDFTRLIQYLQSQPNIDLQDKLRNQVYFKKIPKNILKSDRFNGVTSPNKTFAFQKLNEKDSTDLSFCLKKANMKSRKRFFSPKGTKVDQQNNETSEKIYQSKLVKRQHIKSQENPLNFQRKEAGLSNLLLSDRQTPFNKTIKDCPWFLKRGVNTIKNIQLSNGQKKLKIQNFIILKSLGQGSFGQVFAAIHKQSESIYTIKRFKKQIIKSHELEYKFIHNIKVQMKINHPHIAKLYGFFDDSAYFYMVSQYMQSGNLVKTIEEKGGRLPQTEVMRKIFEINDAILYLHQKNLIHRDIKPASILTCLNVCKLCDTEWLQQNSNAPHHITFCKQLDYMPPEAIANKQITAQFDIWGLGLIAYELLTGNKLIQGDSQRILIRKIFNLKKQLIEVMIPKQCSETIRHLILSCLQPMPFKRLTSSKINQIKIEKQKQWSKMIKNPIFGEKLIVTSPKGSPKNC